MFRGKPFYKTTLYIVGIVHFFDVLLFPYLESKPGLHYWTAATLLLLIVGTLSNAITVKYLVSQHTYNNRHFHLWILILFTLSSQRYMDFLRTFLLTYVYENLSNSWTIKQRDRFFKSVAWLGFVAYYFDCVKFVAVTEIAVSRFVKCLTRKPITSRVWKLVTIAIPLVIATIDFVVHGSLYERGKYSELNNKVDVICIIRMILIVMLIIATLVAAGYRYVRKLNEQFEFSSTCFLILLVMSTYEAILCFLSRNKSWDAMEIYRFDQWKLIFFASYGLVMLYTDNNYKKGVQRNVQESLESEAIESHFQLLQSNQQDSVSRHYPQR